MIKKKRKKLKSDKDLAIKYVIISISFIILAFVPTYGILINTESGKVLTPQYEEISESNIQFLNVALRTEKFIYQLLYDYGVKEKEISFDSISPKKQNGRVWEFASMKVRISNYNKLNNIEKSLDKINSLKNDYISVKKNKISKNIIKYDFYTQGYNTHQLILIYNGKIKKPSEVIPKVVIIIDDLGYDLEMARAFISLNIPLDMSILPFAPYSKKIAEELINTNKELMLHFPMEPKGYPDIIPGKGALFTSMDDKELFRVISWDLHEIKRVKGVNNHMGSRFTENEEKMRLFLGEVKKRDLFFVDSITTPNSVGYRIAKELGIRSFKRDVFLDPHREYEVIRFQMKKLLGIAKSKKSAIGIAHPYPETLEVIREFEKILKEDVIMTNISHITG